MACICFCEAVGGSTVGGGTKEDVILLDEDLSPM
jgi:hypothetical protein